MKRKPFKIFFFLSLLIVVLYLSLLVISLSDNIIFAKNSYESCFSIFGRMAMPILIFSNIIFFFASKKSVITSVIAVCSFSIITFFIYFIMEIIIWDVCLYSNKTLYNNKKNESTKIISRSFGCGATDSSYSIPKIWKMESRTFIFNNLMEIDMDTLDLNQWKEIE